MAASSSFSRDIQQSKYNPAWLKMERIGELWKTINTVHMNPVLFNEQTQTWNYEIWFTSLNSLMQEGMPKFDDGEKVEVKKRMNCLQEFMKLHPTHTMTYKVKNGFKFDWRFNKSHWEILRRELVMYESMIRELLDIHNLDTPNKIGDEGLF